MTGRRRALAAAALAAAVAACMLVSVAPRVGAVPISMYIHVSDGGIPTPGAYVNLTNMRSGWRAGGLMDANGTYFVGIPFEDPGSSIVGGDTVFVTAAKAGRTAVTSFAVSSQPSAMVELSLALSPNSAPSPPVVTSLTEGETWVDIVWTESSDTDFGRYEVYVSTSAGTYGSQEWSSSNVKSCSCRIDGLSPGTKYYLRVAAVDAGGAAAYSDQRAFTTEGTSEGSYGYLMAAIVVSALVLLVYLFARSRRRRGQGAQPKSGQRRRRRPR